MLSKDFSSLTKFQHQVKQDMLSRHVQLTLAFMPAMLVKVAVANAEQGNWTRVFLMDAAAKGAVCIDGSPGAFYIRTSNANGTAPANPHKWVLFMEGGGWTSSDTASVARAQTDLGSSKRYPPSDQFEPGYEYRAGESPPS